MNDLLRLLSPSRMRIARFVKSRGSTTVRETVDSLDLAETTIRQHFDRMLENGLLESESVPDGPGRPTLFYRLTAAGERLFPDQNGRLFGRLVSFLVREGYPGVLDAFFRETWSERGEVLSARFDESGASSLEERLPILEEFLADEGFVPEVTVEDEKVTIRECNCPLSEGVRTTRLPCRLEAQFLQRAIGRELSRVGYMPDGHPACVYEFEIGDGTPDAAGGEASKEP